ncbi:MAG TPA: hypothetical protein VFZ69_05270 [Longimicrobiales bacterium]
MRAGWLIALAAGAAIAVAPPAELEAQGNSNRARQQQELQRQRQQAREQARRQTERNRARQQRDRQQLPAGIVLRRNDRDREYERNRDRRYERNDPWDVILGRRDGRYDDRYDDRYRRNGPPFCRNGQGHPVHGRQWCRDKGYGLGRDRYEDIWGDIVYRDRRYDRRTMNRSVLERVLGSVVLGRFDSYGRNYYGSGSLNGRWLDDRASVLQLYVGSMPIARLIDSNWDGRVDSVSLIR